MVKSLLLLSSVIWLAFNLTLASGPNPEHLAQEPASGAKNPVKPTPESQAKAKKTYEFDCAMCHGSNGDGKTDLAKGMELTLTDLSDAKTLNSKSDADLFEIIRKGKGKMPPEEESRAKADDVWNLVIYTRNLAKNSTATAAPPSQ